MTSSPSLRVILVVSLLLGCSLVSGCGLAQSKTNAEKVLVRHFQAIATNGYFEAAADYGSRL